MTHTNVAVPELDHDAMMLKRFGHAVSPEGRLERRIVANLIGHLEARNLRVVAVHDYETETPVTDAKSAMELVFNLDGCNLHVAGPSGEVNVLVLVLGNGIDLLADWFIPQPDTDGFNAALEAFDAEDFA